MPPLRMHRDHHLIRQGPLTGQVRQVGRAVHPDVKPGFHPVPDAGAGMVPSSAGVGEEKHLCVVHIITGFADNGQIPVIISFPQRPDVMSGQRTGVPCGVWTRDRCVETVPFAEYWRAASPHRDAG